MRKLVTIRKITKISPIKNADFIELASVDGWKSIVKKGLYKEGDYALYLEIDSLIPFNTPAVDFLQTTKKYLGEKWKYVRTISLREQLSQGLIVEISQFPEIVSLINGKPENFLNYDFSEMLGVVKYEPPSEANMGDMSGDLPSYIKRTGEKRIQNVYDILKEHYSDVVFVPTLKMDGTSLTACYIQEPSYFVGKDLDYEKMTDQFWIGSHRSVVKTPEELEKDFLEKKRIAEEKGVEFHNRRNVKKSAFHEALEAIDLEAKMKLWFQKHKKQIAVQGELMGPKIQGNYEKFNDYTFRAFYIYFIDEGRRASYDEFEEICTEMDIPTVQSFEPIKVFEVFKSSDEILDFAEGVSENRPDREGLVFKSRGLHNGKPISFKAISNSYLLGKHGD